MRRVRPVGSLPFGQQNSTRLLSRPLLQALRSSRLGDGSGLERPLSVPRTTRLPPGSWPLSLAPDDSPSFSTVDVWRGDSVGCYTHHCLSTCRPQWSISHLPASLRRGLPRSHWNQVCLVVPLPNGKRAGRQGCCPFTCLSTRPSHDARPPLEFLSKSKSSVSMSMRRLNVSRAPTPENFDLERRASSDAPLPKFIF